MSWNVGLQINNLYQLIKALQASAIVSPLTAPLDLGGQNLTNGGVIQCVTLNATNITGSVVASQIFTTGITTNTTLYPVFVDSNNTVGAEIAYTDGNVTALSYNPVGSVLTAGTIRTTDLSNPSSTISIGSTTLKSGATLNTSAGTLTANAVGATTLTTTNLGATSGSVIVTSPLDLQTGNISNAGTITATTFVGALSGNASTATTATTAGSATTATTATNIAGGAGGSLPYQTGASTTALLPAGISGQLLTSNGAGIAPSWTNPAPTGVTSFQTNLSGLTPAITTTGAVTLSGTLGVSSGGTGVTTSTGTGAVVLSTSPSLTTPVLGTPASGTLTSCTGYQTSNLSGQVTNAQLQNSSVTIGNSTATALGGSASLDSILGVSTNGFLSRTSGNTLGVTTSTGTGSVVLADSPTLTGIPLAPTATGGTNTTQLATCQFVTSAVAAIPASVSSFQTSLSGLTPSTSTTGAVTLAGTLGAGSGGTGVTASSGNNSVVLRDGNQNIGVNNISRKITTTVSNNATTLVLTVASTAIQNIIGSQTQQINLPDPVVAPLPLGISYTILNNSTQTVTINNGVGFPLHQVTASDETEMILVDDTGFGTWSVSSFSFGVTSFSSGSTGLTPASTTTGAITLGGTLAVANGGTGVTSSDSGTGNSVVIRDVDKNIKANNITLNTLVLTDDVASTILTASSAPYITINNGVTPQATVSITLPNSMTIQVGTIYYINNNTIRSIIVLLSGGGTLTTLTAGTNVEFILMDQSPSPQGTWDYHGFLPSTITASSSSGTATIETTGSTALTVRGGTNANVNLQSQGTGVLTIGGFTAGGTVNLNTNNITNGGTVRASNVSYPIQLGAGATTTPSGVRYIYLATSGTFQLPDATTLPTGFTYYVKNTGTTTSPVNNFSGTTLFSLVAGSSVEIIAVSVATADGSWDFHSYIPSTGVVTLNNVLNTFRTNSSGTTLTLTATSQAVQIIFGTLAQIVVLPNVATLLLGHTFTFINNSAGSLTIRDHQATPVTVQTVTTGSTTLGNIITVTYQNATTPFWSVGAQFFARNVIGASANRILYNSSANTTAQLGVSNAGSFLYGTASAPAWTGGSTTIGSFPFCSTTAGVIAHSGGSTALGAIPYISSATAGNPVWSAGSIVVGAIPYTSTTGGVPAFLPAGTTGQVLSWGATIPQWVSAVALATNLASGTAGQVPYQTGVGTTTFTTGGANGNVLTIVSGVPAWSAAASGGPLFVYNTSNLAVGRAYSGITGIGLNNILIGDPSAATNTTLTTGNLNTIVGNKAGDVLTTGAGNTFIGYAAGEKQTTTNANTLIGAGAGSLITTAQAITCIGNTSAQNVTTGNNSIYIGYATASGTVGGSGTGEIVIGSSVTGNGSNTTTIGGSVFYSPPTILPTSGSNVSINGVIALANATTGTCLLGSAVNYVGGGNSNNDYSVVIGNGSTGGGVSGSGTGAYQNVIVGGGTATRITTGNSNTFVGNAGGTAVTTGIGNTLTGFGNGVNITTGNYNVCLGVGAGNGGGLTTGEYNTYLGTNAFSSGATVLNEIVIGNATGQGSNSAIIKCNQNQFFMSGYTAGTSIGILSTGAITSSSDSRIKHSIQYLTKDGNMEIIMGLKPASYKRNDDTYKEKWVGFIAQDLLEVIPNCIDGKKYPYLYEADKTGKPLFDEEGNIIYKKNENGELMPRYLSVDFNEIWTRTVLAVQEQQTTITAQQAQIDTLTIQNQSFAQHIATLTDTLNALLAKYPL